MQLTSRFKAKLALAFCVLGFFAVAHHRAMACYKENPYQDWCYEPLYCNDIVPTTMATFDPNIEVGYMNYNTVEYWCWGCEATYETEQLSDWNYCTV